MLRMYDLVNSACCDSIIDKVSADRLDLSVYCCADLIRELVTV